MLYDTDWDLVTCLLLMGWALFLGWRALLRKAHTGVAAFIEEDLETCLILTLKFS